MVLEENIGGKTKKLTFFVVALKTQAKPTKSTTPTLKKRPLYNCLLVLLLHTAAVTKDLGGGQGSGLEGNAPNVKPRLGESNVKACFLFRI